MLAAVALSVGTMPRTLIQFTRVVKKLLNNKINCFKTRNVASTTNGFVQHNRSTKGNKKTAKITNNSLQ